MSLLLAAVTLAISLTLVNFLHKSPPHGDDKAVTWNENRYPREVVCGRTWSAPSHLLLAKAAIAWEEIDHMHQASTRRRGTTLSEEATQSKLGRSGGPAVDGISGEDHCL